MTENPEAKNKKRDSNTKSGDNSSLSERIEGYTPTDTPTNSSNENTEPKKERSRTRLPEWIIIFLTFALCVIAFLQWTVLKQTDETSRLRDRAYIFFSNPTIEPWPPKPENPTTWRILINAMNTGNMPAQRVSIRYACIETDKYIDDPWPLAKWVTAGGPKTVHAKEGVILQGGGIPLDTFEKARNFKKYIFILIEAKYTDGFDFNKIRITQTSRSLRFDTQGYTSLGLAGPHNCIDDDCNGN